ncbi:P-type conjugative transfer protein TrbL [Chitinimonas arctica]|uniref:P-type conjugative transfer protein TrbL n=1 Tax=Chitinimonas arctica TaxID=2594795 RepID=A0A516SHG2_9NEIS|nr:P-type conjugative transfer protein TrbL [Chitinimonas arctica]QDQ27570.1 P-type conjugative transfer protein TrbL [Chitinimonas arctica]
MSITSVWGATLPLPSLLVPWLDSRFLKSCAVLLIKVALFYFAISLVALAAEGKVGGQTANFELFDNLLTRAETTAGKWQVDIGKLVTETFKILAVLELCWAAAIWTMEKDSLNSLAVEVIKKLMFIGFFYALLLNAPDWIPKIINTFKEVGEDTAGQEALSTDKIIAMGLAVIKVIWTGAPTGFFSVIAGLGKILMAAFVSLIIVIAFVVTAAQYFTLMLESYILLAAGAIFLGLGSSSFTKDYVHKYLSYAINVGVRLLVLILTLSLLLSAIEDGVKDYRFDYGPMLSVLGMALMTTLMAIKAPEMAGALLNGSVGLSAGGASGAASSASSGVMSAAGGIKGVLGKGISAATGVGNAVNAGMAGLKMGAAMGGKAGGGGGVGGMLGKVGGGALGGLGGLAATAANAGVKMATGKDIAGKIAAKQNPDLKKDADFNKAGPAKKSLAMMEGFRDKMDGKGGGSSGTSGSGSSGAGTGSGSGSGGGSGGSIGSAGASGGTGNAGKDGNGKDGNNGKDGSSGKDGQVGAVGAAGQAGQAGQAGARGDGGSSGSGGSGGGSNAGSGSEHRASSLGGLKKATDLS